MKASVMHSPQDARGQDLHSFRIDAEHPKKKRASWLHHSSATTTRYLASHTEHFAEIRPQSAAKRLDFFFFFRFIVGDKFESLLPSTLSFAESWSRFKLT